MKQLPVLSYIIAAVNGRSHTSSLFSLLYHFETKDGQQTEFCFFSYRCYDLRLKCLDHCPTIAKESIKNLSHSTHNTELDFIAVLISFPRNKHRRRFSKSYHTL